MKINGEQYWNKKEIEKRIHDWWNNFVLNEKKEFDYPDVYKLKEEFA